MAIREKRDLVYYVIRYKKSGRVRFIGRDKELNALDKLYGKGI